MLYISILEMMLPITNSRSYWSPISKSIGLQAVFSTIKMPNILILLMILRSLII